MYGRHFRFWLVTFLGLQRPGLGSSVSFFVAGSRSPTGFPDRRLDGARRDDFTVAALLIVTVFIVTLIVLTVLLVPLLPHTPALISHIPGHSGA